MLVVVVGGLTQAVVPSQSLKRTQPQPSAERSEGRHQQPIEIGLCILSSGSIPERKRRRGNDKRSLPVDITSKCGEVGACEAFCTGANDALHHAVGVGIGFSNVSFFQVVS